MTDIDDVLAPFLSDRDGACFRSPLSDEEFERARRELWEGSGVYVFRGLLRPELIEEAREFWSTFLARSRPRETWIRCAGSRNFRRDYVRGWRKGTRDALQRFNNFWWNPPDHDVTYDLAFHLHALRNRLCGQSPGVGLGLSPVHPGTCFTINHYPPGASGIRHRDRDQVLPIVFVLPLSFLGNHFSGGGLTVWDRSERPHRLDEKGDLRPGDVVFYHGLLPHSIEVIDRPRLPQSIRWEDPRGRWVVVSHPQYFGPKPSRWRNALEMLRGRMPRIFHGPLLYNRTMLRIWRRWISR